MTIYKLFLCLFANIANSENLQFAPNVRRHGILWLLSRSAFDCQYVSDRPVLIEFSRRPFIGIHSACASTCSRYAATSRGANQPSCDIAFDPRKLIMAQRYLDREFNSVSADNVFSNLFFRNVRGFSSCQYQQLIV